MANRLNSKTSVYINEALIIKACNTPGGSGGVAKEMNRWAKRAKQRAIMLSPENNPMNATHRGGVVGTYRRSFVTKRQGNGHVLVRTLYNVAPHAPFVEWGRRSTHFGNDIWGREWTRTPTHWLGRQGGGLRGYDPTKRYTYFRQDPALATVARKWERFGWTRYGGIVHWYAGTTQRVGKRVLERAWKWSTRKYAVAYKAPLIWKNEWGPRPR